MIVKPEDLYPVAEHGYIFEDWQKNTRIWPRLYGETLSQAGAFNFFLRVGYSPIIIGGDCLNTTAQKGDVVIFDVPKGLPEPSRTLLEQVLDSPASVILSGDLAAIPTEILGLQFEALTAETPYNTFALSTKNQTLPICPAKWPIFRTTSTLSSRWRGSGLLVEIFGNRIDHAVALRRSVPQGVSAIYASKPDPLSGRSICCINGRIFAAFQSWLQGQEDLAPWLGWANRLCWLDDYVEFIFGELFSSSPALKNLMADKIGHDTTVTLRHDNDDSIDFGFMEIEKASGSPATYAVLDDHNSDIWVKKLSSDPLFETALHYSTIVPKYDLPELLRKIIDRIGLYGLINGTKISAEAIGRGRLRKQLLKAKKHGINMKTIHRHFAYLPYPEYIDALDSVFNPSFGVIGAMSLFRAQIFRWGSKSLDGESSNTVSWPDVQIPYWYPFRIAHAADRGRILPGWEASLMLEPEPELVNQVLESRYCYIKLRHINFGYHPFNANGSDFLHKAPKESVHDVIEICRLRKVKIKRYDNFIEELNMTIDG